MRKLIFSMSIPMMFSMLVSSLYNIVDSIFVSKLGEDALTAVTLAFPLQMLTVAISVGTGVGAASLISRLLGEKRDEDAKKAATHGLLLGVVSAIAFCLFGVFGTEAFIRTQTTNQVVYEMAVDYTFIVISASFGLFLTIVCEKLLQSSGNMIYAMLVQLLGAAINIALDPILIFGLLGFPALGVSGAALATITGQIISMIFAYYLLFTKKLPSTPKLKGVKISFKTIIDIYRVGLPAIVMQSISAFIIVMLNGILMDFTQAAVAVLGVYYKLQSFVYMPIFGLTHGLLPIMAYNYGAKNKKRLISALLNGVVSAIAIMFAGFLIFQLLTDPLLALFNSTPEMYDIGRIALRTLSYAFVPAGYCIVSSTLFQAAGRGAMSLVASLVRQLLALVPFAYFGSQIIGMNAVWIAFPFAEISAAVMVTIFLVNLYRKDISKFSTQIDTDNTTLEI